MSIAKYILIYCAIEYTIIEILLLNKYLKSGRLNSNVKGAFIVSSLFSGVGLAFLQFLIQAGIALFIKWSLSLFHVVAENNFVYAGIIIVIDIIRLFISEVMHRKDRRQKVMEELERLKKNNSIDLSRPIRESYERVSFNFHNLRTGIILRENAGFVIEQVLELKNFIEEHGYEDGDSNSLRIRDLNNMLYDIDVMKKGGTMPDRLYYSIAD